MIATTWAKEVLAARREKRDMLKAGWEYVGESGGRLWELYRGGRQDMMIVDVRIAHGGRAFWIKTARRDGAA